MDIHFQLAPDAGNEGNAGNTDNAGDADHTGDAVFNRVNADHTGNAGHTGHTGDAVFNRVNFSVRSNFTEGWNVLVQTLSQPGLELSEEEGQVSFLYTKKEPRPAFCYRILKSEAASRVQFVTVVAPYEKEIPKIRVRIVGDPDQASPVIHLEIEENGIKKQIGYTL